MIQVLIEAADGPVFVPHTPEEYERLLAGVDVEAAWLAAGPLEGCDGASGGRAQ
jgi:hypothetical protein